MFDFITLEDFDSFPHFRIGCAIFEKCSESFYQVSNDVSIHLINIGTTFIFLSKNTFLWVPQRGSTSKQKDFQISLIALLLSFATFVVIKTMPVNALFW